MAADHDAAGRVITLLRSFTIEIDRFVEVFSGAHGMHRTDLNAVVQVWEADREGRPLTAGELSRRLLLSPAATTALIGRLELAGHVVREHDTADRRRVHLLMQPSAQELAVAFFGLLGEHMRAAMATYNDKDITLVGQFIEGMLTATIAAQAATATAVRSGAVRSGAVRSAAVTKDEVAR